ncbi:hypothetical protein ACWCQQ_03125 [Streptomyces sp. NPDC002143]
MTLTVREAVNRFLRDTGMATVLGRQAPSLLRLYVKFARQPERVAAGSAVLA